MNDILNSMQNLFAMKLVTWQMEGRNEEVDQCLRTMKDFDEAESGLRYYKTKLGTVIGTVSCKPESEDVKNWVGGYFKSKGATKIYFHENAFTYKKDGKLCEGVSHRITYTPRAELAREYIEQFHPEVCKAEWW